MKDLQALRQNPDLQDSIFYPLLAAEFRRNIGHLVSQHAKGMLVEGEAEPLIRREDRTWNSLSRMKPYSSKLATLTPGTGGNQRSSGSSRRTPPPFIMKPMAQLPRGIFQVMEHLQVASTSPR
jgi:hypothetical protein